MSKQTTQASYEIIPDAPGTGRSQAKLTTDFWQWSYSIPFEQSPFNDTTGEFANLNQSGPVFFLTGAIYVAAPGGPVGGEPASPNTTRVIEVPRNKEIFLPVLNIESNNAQLQFAFGTDDPETPDNENFFAGLPNNGILTPEELRNLNESLMGVATDMFFRVGKKVVDENGHPNIIFDTIFSDQDFDGLVQYRQVTPTPRGFNYRIPEDNTLGLPLEATDNGNGLIQGAMSDGIWINLKLAPGNPVLSFGGVFNLEDIAIDLDGDGIDNELGKEAAYLAAHQAAFAGSPTFEVGVNYDITQL